MLWECYFDTVIANIICQGWGLGILCNYVWNMENWNELTSDRVFAISDPNIRVGSKEEIKGKTFNELRAQ